MTDNPKEGGRRNGDERNAHDNEGQMGLHERNRPEKVAEGAPHAHPKAHTQEIGNCKAGQFEPGSSSNEGDEGPNERNKAPENDGENTVFLEKTFGSPQGMTFNVPAKERPF